MAKRGGSVLGLDAFGGPLHLWSNEDDGVAVYETISNFFSKLKAKSIE
jgi:hypothetical protein